MRSRTLLAHDHTQLTAVLPDAVCRAHMRLLSSTRRRGASSPRGTQRERRSSSGAPPRSTDRCSSPATSESWRWRLRCTAAFSLHHVRLSCTCHVALNACACICKGRVIIPQCFGRRCQCVCTFHPQVAHRIAVHQCGQLPAGCLLHQQHGGDDGHCHEHEVCLCCRWG